MPTQERAKERARRIVEAASDVFAEQGLEAATMEGIAERAETSIGSIYQFFPNKLALFNALARSFHDKARGFFDLLLSGPLLDLPWEDLLDQGIDALVLFHANEPGFRAVWKGLQVTQQVIVEGEAINREFAKRIEAVLAAKLPGLPEQSRAVTATVIVEVLTAVLIVSARRPDEAPGLLAETKAMLKRYLAPYVASSAGAVAGVAGVAPESPAPARGKGSDRPRAKLRSGR